MIGRYSKVRKSFGQPISSLYAIQEKIAGMSVRVDASRLLIYKAAMLKDAGITAIYTTEYTRTKDTAAPLAAALKVTAEIVSARDQAALISKIKAHSAGAVLVVGHSNTVPTIIKALGGADVTLAETEYDSLFFVAPGGVTTRIRFKP